MHFSGPSRSGSELRQPSEAQIQLGLCFVTFPGPSSSGVWQARSPWLVTFSAAAPQLSGWTAGAPCEADCDCPAPPEVLAKKPACSLVGKSLRGCDCPTPALTALAACPWRGMVCSRLFPFRPLFCAWSWVSYVRAFHMVAIPQSGLLAQVSSFWLRVGHSCLILTKHCSPHLPRLPALPPLVSGGCRRLCCFSAGGVTVGLVICWF